MIFSKIKNITLFEGKVGIRIKFWKNLTKKEMYFLNKIHFNFLGIKIFSFIIPKVDKGRCVINEEKKSLIEKRCRIFLKRNDENKIYWDKPKLNYYAYNNNGKIIGDFNLALNFLNNNLILDNEYPDEIFEKYIDKKLVGYGYVRDSSFFFEIGDKIYNENYVITRKDLTAKEFYDVKNGFMNNQETIGYFEDEKKIEYILNEFLPKKKGERVIKNLKEAKISALNYAKSKKSKNNY